MLRFIIGFLLMLGGAGSVDLGGSLMIGAATMITGLSIMHWGVKNLDTRF